MSSYDMLRAKLLGKSPEMLEDLVDRVFVPADLMVLIGRAMASPDVPQAVKGALVFSGLYTASGIDVLPEDWLGPVGLVDDAMTVMEALHLLLNETDQSVVYGLWSGDPASLMMLQKSVKKWRGTAKRYVITPILAWLNELIRSRVLAYAKSR